MRYRVTRDWVASYADPIRLRAGEAVVTDGRQARWEGHLWLWARAGDGREGWVPDTWLRRDGAGWCARCDYSAEELSCVRGQALDGGEAVHGWVWCRADDGGEGWVPRRNLLPVAG